MTSYMASSGLWETVILTKLYLPQMAPWDVQRVTPGAKWLGTLVLVQDHIHTSAVCCIQKLCDPLPPCGRRSCRLSTVGNWMDKGSYLRWRTWVLNRTSSHMLDNWNFPVFLLRDGPLTLMYMASIMVLVMLCASLPTKENLSTLT